MDENKPTDVPGHVDFQNPTEARAWAEQATAKRPSREEFFRIFSGEISRLGVEEASVLELGSGPGFLAQKILEVLPHAEYPALDFSPAMHELARERLGHLSGGVRFVEANFQQPDWNIGMPTFDAVVSMQSAHEVRHKSRVPALYAHVRRLLGKGGCFLVCDHIVGEGGMTDTELFMTVAEQEDALRKAGFTEVTLLLEKGGMALWRARDRSS